MSEAKRLAGEKAIDYVEDGMIVGVGTGSTVAFFIDALARIKHRIEGAVSSVLAAGYRTRDLVRPGQTGLTTAEMGRKVAEAVVPQSKPQMAIR